MRATFLQLAAAILSAVRACPENIRKRWARAWLACLLFAALPVPGLAQGAEQTFDILEYRIEGNTRLSNLEIERAVYRHLGPGRAFKDVEAAREALERAYHDAGYLSVFVDIPEQKVGDGVVMLRVAEGSVERLRISGARYYSPGEIRRAVPSVAAGEVPYFPDLQKELAALGSAPDRQVTPLLRPGRDPGKLEVELKVDDRLPLHGSVELSNRRSPDTDNLRLEAALRYDNLWQAQHSAGLRYITTPRESDQIEILVGTYALPLGKPGAQLVLYAIYSDTSVIASGDIGQLGKGTTYGLRYVYPLRARGGLFHSLSAGFDYRNLEESTLLTGTDRSDKPLRYVPLSAQYTGGHQGESGAWEFAVGTTLGLRGLSEREIDCEGVRLDQFACRRAGAQSNFATLRYELQRTQRLAGDWSLLARLDGQLATQPLVSVEQFVIGGVESVRGYLEAEQLGDVGLRSRLELRTPNLALAEAADAQVSALAFFDWGQARIREPLPAQQARFTLASTGLGLRLNAWKNLKLLLDVAHALHAGSRTRDGETRVHVRLAYDF